MWKGLEAGRLGGRKECREHFFFVKVFCLLNQRKKDTVYMISVNHMATLTYILIHSWSYLLVCTSIKKKLRYLNNLL